jgi:hypothetical protein
MSTTKWDALLKVLVTNGTFPNVINRCLLWGPPRTGKSRIAETLFGSNVQRVTLHRQMPVDDLVGGIGLDNGTTRWLDGPATRAMRNGSVLVIDEVDQFSAEIRCALHAVLDDPAGYTLSNGERVNAVNGYAVIATTNALPSSLPTALYDRFDLVLKADTLSAGLERALGAFAKPAKACVGKDGSYSWERPASVNLFLAAAKLRAKGLSDTAIAECLGLSGRAQTDFLAAIAVRS